MRGLAAAALVAVAATGCSSEGPPAGAPDYAGVIEKRERGRALVYLGAGDDCGRTWVLVGEGTDFLRETEPGKYEGAAWSDVIVGVAADVWLADAPEITTCPGLSPTGTVVLAAD